jgi:hypothetical protein
LHFLYRLTVTTATGMAAAPESGAVFIVGIMTCIAYMAAAVPGLVSLKMLERLGSASGHRASVTVTRIVAVIDVAVEAVRAVEPWTGSDEESAGKPVRA